MRPHIIAVLAILLPLPAIAALEFERSLAEPPVAFGDASTDATFTFTNAGENPVAITGVRTSCGCTVAKVQERAYAPGETGEIRLHFDFGHRQGLQEKRAHVLTSDGANPALTLRVTIPEALRIEPRHLLWRAEEGLGPKTVTLTVHPEAALTLRGARVRGEAFTAELTRAERPQSAREAPPATSAETTPGSARPEVYHLVVTPRAGLTRAVERIELDTDFPANPEKPFVLFAMVR
jgi:hypothetical protein